MKSKAEKSCHLDGAGRRVQDEEMEDAICAWIVEQRGTNGEWHMKDLLCLCDME